MYFSSFLERKTQSFFVLVTWIAAIIFFAQEKLGIIQPTRVMHMCFLIVSISIPLYVISLEVKIRQQRNYDFFNKNRTVIFTDGGIDYIIDSKKKGDHDNWEDIKFLHETKSLFIVVKDNKHRIPIEKNKTEENELENIRMDLTGILGTRYKRTRLI